jgi:hypothetical protein
MAKEKPADHDVSRQLCGNLRAMFEQNHLAFSYYGPGLSWGQVEFLCQPFKGDPVNQPPAEHCTVSF